MPFLHTKNTSWDFYTDSLEIVSEILSEILGRIALVISSFFNGVICDIAQVTSDIPLGFFFGRSSIDCIKKYWNNSGKSSWRNFLKNPSRIVWRNPLKNSWMYFWRFLKDVLNIFWKKMLKLYLQLSLEDFVHKCLGEYFKNTPSDNS